MRERSVRNYSEEIISFIKYHFNHKAIGFLFVVIILFYLVSIIPTKIAYADQNTVSYKTFQSVEIKTGDTLWSIATKYYTEEYKSIQNYIEVIKESNSLKSDTIHSGCYLIIPYYQN